MQLKVFKTVIQEKFTYVTLSMSVAIGLEPLLLPQSQMLEICLFISFFYIYLH